MRRLFLLLIVLHAAGQQLASGPLEAKTGAAAMSPAEAFDYASQPFNQARAQPNDLTEADRWALGVSIQRAAEACQALTPYKHLDEQLLSLGKLCVLGQQFEPAGEALVPYLSVPNAKYEEGGLLLSRAYIGMDQLTSSESQIESLMARFSYDASIHYGIDTLIEAAEGKNKVNDELVQRLNEQQLPLIMAALKKKGYLSNTDLSPTVPAVMLFEDSLRCARQLRADGKHSEANAVLTQLKQIATSPQYAQSSQLPSMQGALRRYELMGTEADLKTMRARLVSRAGTGRDSMMPRSVSVRDKPVVLIVVALSAPASVDVVTKMTELLKPSAGNSTPATIYAVTSYGANGGDEKNPVPGMTRALHDLANALPANIPLYLLDDATLQGFAIDLAPMAIALDAHGHLRFLAALATEGDERMLRDAAVPRKLDSIVVDAAETK